MAKTKPRGVEIGIRGSCGNYGDRLGDPSPFQNISSSELARLCDECNSHVSEDAAGARSESYAFVSPSKTYKYAEGQPSDSTSGVTSFNSMLELYAPVILLLYLAVGTGVYAWREGWSFWNSLYFCIISLLTVGYGDLSPTSNSMKIFTVFFVYVGLAFVAGTVGLLVGRTLASVTEDDDLVPSKKWGMSQNVREVVGAVVVMIVLGSIGTAFYYSNEELSIVDAFYFSMITLATVGYGDIVTTKQSTRLFGTFFVFFGVSMMAYAVGRFATVLARVEQQKQINEFIKKGITTEVIEALDADGSGYIDKAEFLEYMLVQVGACKRSDVRKFSSMFSCLDADGGGTLDINDAVNGRRTTCV